MTVNTYQAVMYLPNNHKKKDLFPRTGPLSHEDHRQCNHQYHRLLTKIVDCLREYN